MEEFVQSSGDHGVIIFSLGMSIPSLGDAHLIDMFSKVFSRLPQRVIWRHEGDQPSNLAENVKIMKWIPQTDLLGEFHSHFSQRPFCNRGSSQLLLLNGSY